MKNNFNKLEDTYNSIVDLYLEFAFNNNQDFEALMIN